MTKIQTLKVLRVNPSWKKQKMIKVGFVRRVLDPKYKRYYKTKTSFQAHYEGTVEPKVDSEVKVVPCRPISSTKRYRVVWLKE